ncbi:Probable two-component response regulator [hydrothermal vent metagenome]|uniref:Probable two-component response regulator n=1 Tax=hydrothermal vent metagenome TaxID=652676 RepID=A0A1W1BNM6_9ZZZZ
MKDFENFEKTILLSVDDDEFNQELASAIFDDYKSITVLQANNGKEAISLLDKEVVDLILLDLIMPEMDGFETLDYLKSNAEYRDIPVIVVTSKEEEKRKTYQMGADDFISKPYSPEELKLRVYNHLRIKKFSELLSDIKEENASSSSKLCHLKEAIRIAIGSQKKLLEKLGDIVHENTHKDTHVSKRLGEYSKVMARLNGLNSKEIDNLYYSMSIYDIGLLRISEENRTNMDSKEFKSYPLLGLDVIEDLEETTLIKMSKEVISTHQENWDGTGYPNKLQGENIPLYGRIASIINYYDELTSSRIYSSESISSIEALDIIKREKGVKFDPNLVTLFVDNFEQFRAVKDKWN